MFKQEWIESARLSREDGPPLSAYAQVVTAVDPAGSTKPDSDFTGISTVGLLSDEIHVLYSTRVKATPEGWAAEVARQYYRYGSAVIVAETNFGGDMVESTLRNFDPALAVVTVTAAKGKYIRAEPLSLLYEAGRAHHVGFHHVELEDELVRFTAASKRDDILDTVVYAAEYLRPSGSAWMVASTAADDDGMEFFA